MTLREDLQLKLIRFALAYGNDPELGDPKKAADQVIELSRLIIRAENQEKAS